MNTGRAVTRSFPRAKPFCPAHRGLVGVATQERASTGQHSWPSTRKQSRKPPDRPLISQERAQGGLIVLLLILLLRRR